MFLTFVYGFWDISLWLRRVLCISETRQYVKEKKKKKEEEEEEEDEEERKKDQC